MGYSNSSLVNCTNLSPNHSGQRTHSIDRISPHCVVGQLSAASIASLFTSAAKGASCNYAIGKDGQVALVVEEKNRSWCTSSNANDQRAITIECASDLTSPYAMNDAVYSKLIDLCVDICKRNGKKKLLWFGDKTKSLNYNPASDEMVITVHRWFANKSCPGDWLYNRLGDLASKVTSKLGGSSTSSGTTTSTTASSGSNTTFPAVPFSVKVIIDDLNIRTSPSSANDNNLTGKFTGKGTFTITKLSGQWGYLKSGAGWIYLGNKSYVTIGSTVKASTTQSSSTTTSAKKSVAEVAKEIVAGTGDWGNGETRKQRLEAKGYNYTEVQNAVNALMSGKSTTSTKKSNTEIAKEIIKGTCSDSRWSTWGNGTDRKNRLAAAGYDYNTIQALVNKML